MNPEELVQEVAQYLSEGADPNEIMGSLVEQGLSEEEAGQIIQAAMQMVEGGGSVLAAVAEQDPELLMAILAEFVQLPPESQEQLLQELQGALEGGQAQGQGEEQGQEEAPAEQGTGMF